MYNFLDWKLTPNVLTETPCSDGHEASNLISDVDYVRYRGFLAFSAIKPPVDVDFELICPIKIHYITIWNTVDSQKSSGYEIYGKMDESQYKLIGKTFPEGSGFAMCNRKLYSKNKPSVPVDFSICFFKGSEYKLFNCVDKIRIKIIRTDKSVPCIGKIEIWGQVANSCTEKTKETINYLMKPKIKIPPTNEIEPSTSKCVDTNDFEIPIDFIDVITCEVMSIPMTLPCGKNVDQTTLEKHENNEALHGRGPSDPYTSLPYTSESRPKFNQSLKNRIDEFLLKNKDRVEIMSIPRTVGKRKPDELPDYANVYKKIKPSDQNCLQSTSAEDLDNAIEDTLTKYNITRYSKISQPNIQGSKTSICCFCKGNNNIYLLPACQHFICRQCLLNLRIDCVCNVCKKPFKKSEVHKYHAV